MKTFTRRTLLMGTGAVLGAADIVDVPLHCIVDIVDVRGITSNQEGRQVMPDQGQNRGAATATSIGVTGPLATICKTHRGGNQLKIIMISVLGIDENFCQHHNPDCQQALVIADERPC